MAKPRVCAVSYLNTVPLVWGLLHDDVLRTQVGTATANYRASVLDGTQTRPVLVFAGADLPVVSGQLYRLRSLNGRLLDGARRLWLNEGARIAWAHVLETTGSGELDRAWSAGARQYGKRQRNVPSGSVRI